jgi:hypothetical protein
MVESYSQQFSADAGIVLASTPSTGKAASSSSSSSSAGAAQCASGDGTCDAEGASGHPTAAATAAVVLGTNEGPAKQIDLKALYQSLKIEIEREGKFYINTMNGFIDMGSGFLDGTFTPGQTVLRLMIPAIDSV